MEESKSGVPYRNKSAARSFVLPPREGQKDDFVVGPGQTWMATAVDIKLIGMYHDIVDVAKEAPGITGNSEALRQEVMAERDVSARLKAENDRLREQLALLDPAMAKRVAVNEADGMAEPVAPSEEPEPAQSKRKKKK